MIHTGSSAWELAGSFASSTSTWSAADSPGNYSASRRSGSHRLMTSGQTITATALGHFAYFTTSISVLSVLQLIPPRSCVHLQQDLLLPPPVSLSFFAGSITI